MNTIHTIIQKVFVLGIAFCFMFVAIYVPQSWNKVDKAEAALATTAGQVMINLTNVMQFMKDTITSAATVAIEGLQYLLKYKEFVLDGMGWWVAKMILSQVTRSIVQWINSGFQGSPSFVQDLEGFALRMADQAAGLYLANLGSPLLTQFVCAPFRLNLQIAISTSYRYNRSGMPYGASRCTITNAMKNIDRFTDGSFIHGGWNAFYQMSSQPLTYTPYGEYLAAQNELALRASVSVRNENRLLNFGNGFFSSKVCEMVETAAVSRERCMVSTPGQVISENLNFHLTAGSRSLIAADELNEILGALLGQLAQTAITGAHGLLGMSNNTGYTIPQQGVEAMVDEQATSSDAVKSNYLAEIDAQIAREQKYEAILEAVIPMLTLMGTSETIEEANRASAILAETKENLLILNRIKTDFINGSRPIEELINDYNSIKNLHTDTQINANTAEWEHLFVKEFNLYVKLNKDANAAIVEHEPKLIARAKINDYYGGLAGEQVDIINDVYKPMLALQKTELDLIAMEWNDPSIPRVEVVQHFIDLLNGRITGVPRLFSDDDFTAVVGLWEKYELPNQ